MPGNNSARVIEPENVLAATHSASLDLAPTTLWRRFVPAWLRSLIWVDSARGYDAFLSYSWKSDREVAPTKQATQASQKINVPVRYE